MEAMEQRSLKEWLSYIDEIAAPKELNEEFNKAFSTKGVQYPMKLYSTYILRREKGKGNLSAIRLEAMIKGTLKGQQEELSPYDREILRKARERENMSREEIVAELKRLRELNPLD